MIGLTQNQPIFLAVLQWFRLFVPRSRFEHQLGHALSVTWSLAKVHLPDKLDPANSLEPSSPFSHERQMLLDTSLFVLHQSSLDFRAWGLVHLFVYGGKIYEGLVYAPSENAAAQDILSKSDRYLMNLHISRQALFRLFNFQFICIGNFKNKWRSL